MDLDEHGAAEPAVPIAGDGRPSRSEAEAAVRTLLRWAGEDPSREGLLDTPARVVRAYEEWFAGALPRSAWREFIIGAPGMEEFRHVMFSRLVPNLREIGLLSPRIARRYDEVGLMKYAGGLSADQLSGDAMLAELDRSGGIGAASAA